MSQNTKKRPINRIEKMQEAKSYLPVRKVTHSTYYLLNQVIVPFN